MSGLKWLQGGGAQMVADIPLCGFYEAFVAELKVSAGYWSIDYDCVEIPSSFLPTSVPVLRGSWWSFDAFGGFKFYDPAPLKARFNHGKRASRRKF